MTCEHQSNAVTLIEWAWREASLAGSRGNGRHSANCTDWSYFSCMCAGFREPLEKEQESVDRLIGDRSGEAMFERVVWHIAGFIPSVYSPACDR